MSISQADRWKLQESSRRWFPLPEQVRQHRTIKQYQTDKIRYKTVHAGRRSFKTEIGKRVLVTEALKRPNVRLFFGAPTRDQAKRIAWDDLKLLSLPMIVDKSDTDLYMRLASGSEIWVVGFDAPARFEGTRWNGGILDEFGNMKPSVWNENVGPALADTKGWCWLIGVPEGKNHYYELSEYARTSGNPEWKDYQWLSSEVMDPAEVEKEQERLDERTFRQEYCGTFESYEGRAYPYYSADIHRVVQSISPRVPVFISCDFNLDPCVWEIGQDLGGFISFQDEIKQRQTDIWKMCSELKRRLLERGVGQSYPIIFYGDFEHGQSRSVSAVASSWDIIRQEFNGWSVNFRLRGHPRIIDRVNAVNSKLRNTKGKAMIGIDPKCVELCKDFEQVDMRMLTGGKVNAGDRTHASDTAGYKIAYDYPIVQIQTRQY